jgi:hypothetical protein
MTTEFIVAQFPLVKKNSRVITPFGPQLLNF